MFDTTTLEIPMTTVFKAASAADLLPKIPPMLGYMPTQSIVILPLVNGRTAGAMRVDLPTTHAEAKEMALVVTGHICRMPGVQGVLVATYGTITQYTAFDELSAQLHKAGLVIRDAMHVGPERWISYTNPGEGGPASEAAPDPALLHMVKAGDQGTITLPEPRYPSCTASDVDDEIDYIVANFGDVDREKPLSYVHTSIMMRVLATPSLRDIYLAYVYGGQEHADRAFDAQLNWSAGGEYPTEVAEFMHGTGQGVDPGRMTRALEVCRQVAATSPNPGALGACAWISWALGKSTEANTYAAMGKAIEPDHGLCEIVTAIVAAGHLPDWAFTR